MSDNTKIHWADTTCNPVMGCDGCPLFPTVGRIKAAVGAVMAKYGIKSGEAGIPGVNGLGKMSASEVYFRRKEIAAKVAKRFAGEAGKLANEVERAVASGFACYAGVLHLRHGKDPSKPGKKTNKGYAPSFEQVTPFTGRMADMAGMRDLAGVARPGKPWLDGLPRLVFVSDMGDALSAAVTFEYLRHEIVSVVNSSDGLRHIWLWLTKRPARMAKFAKWLDKQGLDWPRNLVPMTSVIDGRMAKGTGHLLEIPAAVRGLSVEPLLEPVKLDLAGYGWVIVGGESGPYARPFDLAWARDILRQCREAGVACFVKQMGAKPFENGAPLKLADRHGGNWEEWPDDTRVRETPETYKTLTGTMKGSNGKAA